MNLFELKKELCQAFIKANIDKQEVDILICEALDIRLDDLYKTTSISQKMAQKVKKMAKKRLNGMPIQKIFKRAYFFDYVFYINNNVLCPRPETELLTEEVIKLAHSDSKILDLCTGSGCIAITVQKKTGIKVVASDISKKALYVAKKNAKNLGANVKFVFSNMFENIKQKFDIIVSNPPYIPTKICQTLDREVKDFDPIISLDGGEDGLDFYKIICENAKDYLNKNGKVLLEVGINQAKIVEKMLKNAGFYTKIKKDYNNIDRIVIGELYDWKMW